MSAGRRIVGDGPHVGPLGNALDPTPYRHRRASLNALAADARQYPCNDARDVNALFDFVDHMATDCGWEPTASEVKEQQRASRTQILRRVMSQVAERRQLPYVLADMARVCMERTKG